MCKHFVKVTEGSCIMELREVKLTLKQGFLPACRTKENGLTKFPVLNFSTNQVLRIIERTENSIKYFCFTIAVLCFAEFHSSLGKTFFALSTQFIS